MVQEKTPLYRLRLIADVQFYTDGTSKTLRSFCIPEKKQVTPKKKFKVPEAKQDGECEL